MPENSGRRTLWLFSEVHPILCLQRIVWHEKDITHTIFCIPIVFVQMQFFVNYHIRHTHARSFLRLFRFRKLRNILSSRSSYNVPLLIQFSAIRDSNHSIIWQRPFNFTTLTVLVKIDSITESFFVV